MHCLSSLTFAWSAEAEANCSRSLSLSDVGKVKVSWVSNGAVWRQECQSQNPENTANHTHWFTVDVLCVILTLSARTSLSDWSRVSRVLHRRLSKGAIGGLSWHFEDL